ncbi:MAG TPA: hypothetical protein VMW43_12920 [Bacteroidota bacterium]|nr:hypothetical protein [Bacteroidota bacterium]
MGQQQLLLIILGVIIVGIAIAVGIAQFGAHSTQSNKDGVTASLVNVAANAYQFKIRPTTMGGGGGAYTNYTVPTKMAKDDNGTYTLGTVATNSIQILGTSSVNTAWVATCTSDDTGRTSISYSGW